MSATLIPRHAVCLLMVVTPVGRPAVAPLFAPTWPRGSGPAAAQSPIVRTVRIGLYPSFVLVDAPTQRVFVFARTNPNAPDVPEAAAIKVLDAVTGAVLHTVPVGRNTYVDGAAIDPHSGHVLLVTYTTNTLAGIAGRGVIRVLDGRTGAMVHTFPAGVAPQAIVLDAARRQAFILDAGTLDQSGTPTGNATVRDIDAATGHVIRIITIGQIAPTGGGLIVDGRTRRLFVAENGGVRVLDEATGATLARVPISATVLGLALDERAGRVVVGRRFDQFRAEAITILDAGTGKAVRGAFGAGEAVAVDASDGRVVAVNTTTASNGGDIDAQVVDIASGRVVSAPTIGNGAGFLVATAVDESRHHAIVVTWEGQGPLGPSVVSVLDTRSGRGRHDRATLCH